MESVKLEEGFVAFGVLVPTNAKMFGVTKIPKLGGSPNNSGGTHSHRHQRQQTGG